MSFKLTFATDNDAFREGDITETVRILRDVAAKLEAGIEDGAAYDINGNRVGAFKLAGRRG